MRRMMILTVALVVGCSNDPIGKPSNNTANNGQTTGSNNSTTVTNNANISPNLGNCQNNIVYPMCADGFEEVGSCPTGAECETVTSCDVDIVCAPILTVSPASWTTACQEDPACTPAPSNCEVDEDCVLVPSGTICGCLDCPSDAIVQSNEAAYREALMTARDLCEALEQCGDAPCQEFLPHCDLQSFTCVGRESKYVTTTGLPDDCEVAADCVAVFAGEVCDACMCPNEAIPAELVDTYQTAFDVDCAHGVACDCVPFELACNAGACELVMP